MTTQDITVKPPLSQLPEYEKLTFGVKWLGIPVGTVTASINGVKKIKGQDAYELEVVAKTNRFCSAIYKVEDRFVSYMDTEHLYTLRHEAHRREGRYRKEAITSFDQIHHKAYFHNAVDGTSKTFDIPEGVQDTVTAYYFFRMLGLHIGDTIQYTVSNNESNYNFYAVIESKKFMRTPYLGTHEVFYMYPYAKLGGKIVKKGKARGYFTCDERRLPLYTVLKAPIFTEVTISLQKIE